MREHGNDHWHARVTRGHVLGFFLVGIASLLWLLFRTGMKPSRAAYPCQRAAMANASAWLGTLALPTVLPWAGSRRAALREGPWKRFLLFLAVSSLIAAAAAPAVSMLVRGASRAEARTISLQLTARQLPATTFSDIFAVQGTTGADADFQRLIQLMEQKGLSFSSLIGPADVVIIKVNSQWNERGGTNTDLVKSIIDSIVKRPGGFMGEIVIADNGQAQYGSAGRGGSLDWKANNALDTSQSMQKVADLFSPRFRVSTASWDRITTTQVGEYSDGDARSGYVVDSFPSPQTGIIVSYPKFDTPWSTHISFKKGIWDPASNSYDSERLKVINVPVLKSHMIYGVTASVKHYMGVGSDKLTRHSAHGSVGAGGMGTEMAQTRLPVLNVIDAIWINAAPGRGPRTRYSDAVQTNIIAAGRDPVALDCWAAKNILLPASEKLGYGRAESMDPDVTSAGSFGAWLRLSMKELQRAGFASTTDLDAVNITVGALD
ncbi:MAG TPA: DUF362 domain-containing protein [Spirochaetia bacterium]|nr:DUF362 domain-containing protein [Spirochaetia bacterium]